MMTSDTPSDVIWVDTCILVYANLKLSPFHQQTVERLKSYDEKGCELWISRQTLREYLSAMTKQSMLTSAIPLSSLIADVRYFANRFLVGEDGPKVTESLLNLISQSPTGGKQIHDANIVATMLEYGVNRLLTHNVKDFKRFSNVITIIPLETVN